MVGTSTVPCSGGTSASPNLRSSGVGRVAQLTSPGLVLPEGSREVQPGILPHPYGP